ncbi:hypothetical protein [Legionella longbeachae]|uniref:Uncharacterized protein n=1 Tax=Legionella longbeachae serogroup 1 (strain NSW150) TaxID=661367 RepID=D3HN71_LEGLN|nr:hypothetical protein [Legionella longbeachae]VEE00856.1 Uncharacterised protein [Legionella oakridgensis]HBD7399393.1 hypothetical protein [Legionella pneumophila]ARB92744.1 hypothetical protein A6J40_11415 [Legionella longbeachae]ARM34091.1 hypothetical protein B0B39_11375 [Legionella longbeachae]EEZ96676.1 hypothetical protein LLB_1872 [Legionella longbeachae D-4968]
MKLHEIYIPGKSDMLIKDFYKRNNIDSSEYTICLWLENCVGNPVGIPHVYDNLSLTEAYEKVLVEGDKVLQKKGCLPSEFIHHMKIAQRKYCVNLSEESVTPSIQYSTIIERNAGTNLPEKRANTLGFFNKIDPPFKSDMLVKDFYKRNNIDPSEYTICLWLENCVGNPVGIPHKYDDLSLTEAYEKVLVEGDKVLQKKGCLPSEFIHHMKIAQRKYCVNLSEECDTSIGLVPK